MPIELREFQKDRHFSNLKCPSDAKTFGEQFSLFYRSLQPDWRLDETRRKKIRTIGILYNDMWCKVDGDNLDTMCVGGMDGFALVILGAALWHESAKKDRNGRETSKLVTATLVDIHHVLEMMTAYLENKSEEIGMSGAKRKRIEDAKTGNTKKLKKQNSGNKENMGVGGMV